MDISEIFNCLDEQCNLSLSAIRLVSTSEYLKNEEKIIIRDMVIKQAFVSVFTEWEHFLENITIAYSLGAVSIKGHCPKCYINPKDEGHAEQLIKGSSKSKYTDWSDAETVVALEEILFEKGAPFKETFQGFLSKYKEIKVVRNHIVHNSRKSSLEFDSLVRTALYAAKVGISPTEFLLSKKGKNPVFYDIYIGYILNAAKRIAEY